MTTEEAEAKIREWEATIDELKNELDDKGIELKNLEEKCDDWSNYADNLEASLTEANEKLESVKSALELSYRSNDPTVSVPDKPGTL